MYIWAYNIGEKPTSKTQTVPSRPKNKVRTRKFPGSIACMGKKATSVSLMLCLNVMNVTTLIATEFYKIKSKLCCSQMYLDYVI